MTVLPMISSFRSTLMAAPFDGAALREWVRQKLAHAEKLTAVLLGAS